MTSSTSSSPKHPPAAKSASTMPSSISLQMEARSLMEQLAISCAQSSALLDRPEWQEAALADQVQEALAPLVEQALLARAQLGLADQADQQGTPEYLELLDQLARPAALVLRAAMGQRVRQVLDLLDPPVLTRLVRQATPACQELLAALVRLAEEGKQAQQETPVLLVARARQAQRDLERQALRALVRVELRAPLDPQALDQRAPLVYRGVQVRPAPPVADLLDPLALQEARDLAVELAQLARPA